MKDKKRKQDKRIANDVRSAVLDVLKPMLQARENQNKKGKRDER